jgi:hypothetical protein
LGGQSESLVQPPGFLHRKFTQTEGSGQALSLRQNGSRMQRPATQLKVLRQSLSLLQVTGWQ